MPHFSLKVNTTMNKFSINLYKLIFVISFIALVPLQAFSEEEISMFEQIQILQKDIKTLEKAVYSQGASATSGSSELSSNADDVLTKHLLKLSDLEEQFKILTNNFEEINFKLDKLSNRITKAQTDNQIRFQDLEQNSTTEDGKVVLKKKKKLPGSSEPQDLGSVSSSDFISSEQAQQTQSIETVGTVITEKTERTERILPETSAEEQYKFATSFLKIGDYETAEFALREFIDINSSHILAGSAQYWYGETFRVRQLYQDAATAYLDGYQKYPKSKKAPVNLLKLGVMLVKIGEKEQGCSMILGVKDQYPKAAQSVIQKAEYEKKKFNCEKKS